MAARSTARKNAPSHEYRCSRWNRASVTAASASGATVTVTESAASTRSGYIDATVLQPVPARSSAPAPATSES